MSSNDLADRIGISRHDVSRLDVAVLAPCYNEEHAIAKVVADFHAALPAAAVFAAAVYAYDNNSTDGTVAAAGSASKLSTWQDGFRIPWTLLKRCRAERPLPLFGVFGAAPVFMSIGLAIPIVITCAQEGFVLWLPTAVLSTGPMLLAFLSFACGLILDTVTRGRREAKLMAYLALCAAGEERLQG